MYYFFFFLCISRQLNNKHQILFVWIFIDGLFCLPIATTTKIESKKFDFRFLVTGWCNERNLYYVPTNLCPNWEKNNVFFQLTWSEASLEASLPLVFVPFESMSWGVIVLLSMGIVCSGTSSKFTARLLAKGNLVLEFATLNLFKWF